MPAENLIELEGVSKSYREGEREHRVLTEVDATIARGAFVVLLGRSGSGKSTLLNLLAGIDLPDAGAVRVAGRDLARLSETERTLYRRAHIGFVFQSFNLIPTLTVGENVRLRLELNRVGRAVADDKARALLDRVGLADRLASYPEHLSGGEQQRVAIASALAHDPELILADEPTGNLDLAMGRQVVGLLEELVRDRGRTLVMATHSLETVGAADRVLAVEEGHLHERPVAPS